MANTYADYTGDGSNTDFAITFDYIKTSHVVVEVNEGQGAGGLNKWVRKTLGAGADYTVVTSPTKKVVFNSAPGNNVRVRVLRDSDASTGIVDFENGSVLTETELDNSYTHNRYLAEEAEEGITGGALVKNTDGQFDADGLRLENLADPDSDDDAVSKGYADNRYVDVAGDTMTGNLDMGANKVTSSTAPSNGNDLTNKTYVDDTFVDAAGDTMTGQLNMGGNKITNLAGPDAASDAANKNYVDDTITTSFATGSPPPNNQIGTNVIEDDAITFAKLQNINSGNVIGRNIRNPADTGDPEEIPILDEDTMASDSDTSLATQQSIKAYVDDNTATDLGNTPAATNVLITSSTGADTTVPSATTTLAGVMSGADKAKLDGIATGATANAGTVTQVDTGTGLTGGPINSTGTIALDTGGVGTDQLANGSVTSAKISSTDNIQIGGTPTNGTASKFAVVANSSDLVACFENLATDNSGAQVLIRGGTAALYLHDDQNRDLSNNPIPNVNNYGIVVSGGVLRINLINDAGTTSTPLMELNSSGNLRIAGTLTENATF